MQADTYGPGYSAPVVALLSERNAETHAGFFLPRLRSGWHVLCSMRVAAPGRLRSVSPDTWHRGK